MRILPVRLAGLEGHGAADVAPPVRVGGRGPLLVLPCLSSPRYTAGHAPYGTIAQGSAALVLRPRLACGMCWWRVHVGDQVLVGSWYASRHAGTSSAGSHLLPLLKGRAAVVHTTTTERRSWGVGWQAQQG